MAVQMGLFNTPTVISLIKAASSTIAVTSEQRSTCYPAANDDQSGIKDYVVDTWLGLAPLPGTPEPVIARLNAESTASTIAADARKMLAGSTRCRRQRRRLCKKLIKDDFALWLPIIKSSNPP
jgi:tripartite-type tricarboxylate transporter receptor subunit TctC